MEAAKRQATRLTVKEQFMSAHRTQSAMHTGEHAPRPLSRLGSAERRPLHADAMNGAFREHARSPSFASCEAGRHPVVLQGDSWLIQGHSTLKV
jgi:hypothetical protein